MRQHEFFILRRTPDLLAELARTQSAVHQGHGHGLALALAEAEAVATREARRFTGRAAKLIDHLAFGDRDAPERHGKADLFGRKLELGLAKADFTGERMIAAVAALGGVAEGQQKSLVAAREILQAHVARGGKTQGVL